MIQSHKDLEVWKRSMVLVTDLYKATKVFPREEMYGLVSQMRRCAVSIPSNIAEGQGRRGAKEYVRFLKVAYGSMAELETQIIISTNLEYFSTQQQSEFSEELSQIGRMINGLISSLELKLKNSPKS